MPLRVLTSETASAPAPSAAAATAAGSAALGVSFTISGFSVSERTRSTASGGLGRVGAHDEAGLDVGTRDVQLDHRHLVPGPDGRDERRELVAAEAHDGDDQRHGQLRELRAGPTQEALEALVGKADRVDEPAGRLPQPRRRIALPRLGVIVFETKASNGKRSMQRVAEGAPGRDRIEGARSRSAPGRAARRRTARSTGRRSMPRSRDQRGLELGRVQHRPVHAEAHVAVTRRTTQPKQAPNPHAIPDSIASWAGTSALGAERPHGLEHRGRPAGVDRRRVSVEFRREQLRDEGLPADRAVVGDHLRLAGEQRRRLGVRGGAEAEQDPGGRRGRRARPASTTAGPRRFRLRRAARACPPPSRGIRPRVGPGVRGPPPAPAPRAVRCRGRPPPAGRSSAPSVGLRHTLVRGRTRAADRAAHRAPSPPPAVESM